MKVEIYTDGSCKGNPGPGGWAATFLQDEADKPTAVIKGHATATTNNRMEMVAIIEALRHLQQQGFKAATIYSDSNLIVQTMNKHWKRKKNTDLWGELDRLNKTLEVEYIWVRGHANNRWNTYTDKVAVNEAEKAAKLAASGRAIDEPSYENQKSLF